MENLQLANVSIDSTLLEDGSIILNNNIPLSTTNETILDRLDKWADAQGNAIFLRERINNQWHEISYTCFRERMYITAQKLAGLGLSETSPLMTLSHNSIDHAVILFAAMIQGIPVCPVSPSYALNTRSYDRLETIINTIQPGAIYIPDPEPYHNTVVAINDLAPIEFISFTEGRQVANIHELQPYPIDVIEERRRTVDSNAVAKIMLTSGSTGSPKGVIVTHQMMYSNQQALALLWPFLCDNEVILVDWLPWSHTFGGNVCFNVALYHGGTLVIDQGKPIPGLIELSIDNIDMYNPTIHFNVPVGIEALLPILEENERFARAFFSRLQVIFIAAAALPQTTFNRLKDISKRYTKTPPHLFMGWGSTETAPFSSCVYFDTNLSTNLGLPIPGTTLKLSPQQDKMALLVKGPNVTPGYWKNEDATSKAFDKKGFYDMGDAGKLINPSAPEEGVIFDGRLSENFKLLSGTWVNVGKVRVDTLNALRPIIADVVVTAPNKADLGLLLIPNNTCIKEHFSLSDNELSTNSIMTNNEIRSFILDKLNQYNTIHTGNSSHISRVTVLPEPPSIEKNEITDKGYLNQRMLLSNWHDLIERLHANDASDMIFIL